MWRVRAAWPLRVGSVTTRGDGRSVLLLRKLPGRVGNHSMGIQALQLMPAHRCAATATVREISSTMGYPDGSASQELLEKCLEGALGRGTDLAVEYKPWLPVDLMQTLLLDIHEFTGTSWFVSIILAVIGLRVVLLPFSIASMRGGREKAIISPKFQELAAKQQALTEQGDQEKMNQVAEEMKAFQAKHGRFYMLKGLSNLILIQMPLYITAFAAMRGIANHPHMFPSFAMESPLWLDSLALADPYALFPMFTAAVMLTNAELFGSIDSEMAQAINDTKAPTTSAVGGSDTFKKYQKHLARGSAVVFIPLMWSFPASTFVYMSTNLITVAIQNRVLRTPAMERLLELPPTPESIKAAAAAASPTTAPSLVPVAFSLEHLRRTGGLTALTAPQPSRPMLDANRKRAPEVSNIESTSFVGTSRSSNTPSPRTLADLRVSPNFVVKRAQPQHRVQTAT